MQFKTTILQAVTEKLRMGDRSNAHRKGSGSLSQFLTPKYDDSSDTCGDEDVPDCVEII